MHIRLNERESNPNPHVNFISALSVSESGNQEDARQFLRALAAQVRPVMKAHGFEVNTLEEYEYNRVFAGRNWNNGETIELVLRGPSGSFHSTSWLLSTFCHELAHIEHMNHGPAFQALWKQLRAEVRALQGKGYYGDGYWSSGTRLIDSAKVTGDGIEAGEFPEFMCGGAHSRARPTRRKRRINPKRPGEPIASHKTGRQTAKKRKAGGRVTSQEAFVGEGLSLVKNLEPKSKGTGFGKQAASKRAREERALAAERRVQALVESQQAVSTSEVEHDRESSSEDDSDSELVPETDAERRKQMLQSDPEASQSVPGNSWRQFEDDFIFRRQIGNRQNYISSDNDIPTASGSTLVIPAQRKKKTGHDGMQDTIGLGKIVQNEISFRKKEVLGIAPVKPGRRVLGGGIPRSREEPEWACSMCTLINKGGFLACSACDTPRA